MSHFHNITSCDSKKKREIVQITSGLKLCSRAICITFHRHDKKRVTKVVILYPRCCIYALVILSRIGGFNEERSSLMNTQLSPFTLTFLLYCKQVSRCYSPNEPLRVLIAKLHVRKLDAFNDYYQ